MQTQTIKDKITNVVLSQPEDASYDEIMRELALERMVDRGLDVVRAGRVISNGKMENRIRAWQLLNIQLPLDNAHEKNHINTNRELNFIGAILCQV